MNASKSPFLTAAEAAERLGVKLDTIYAYVSRGLLKRLGSDKESRFDPAQVERLAMKGRRNVVPKPQALVITTELTEVTEGAVHYRGQSALELARKNLALVQDKVSSGAASDLDVARARAEIARAEGMLAHERLVANAPADVVEAERARLERYRRERELLGD